MQQLTASSSFAAMLLNRFQVHSNDRSGVSWSSK